MGKRIFDVVAGSALLIAALPIIAVLLAVTSASQRTWPFFTQQRLGRHGRAFLLVKLRTLPACAARYALKEDDAEPAVGAWGRFLRRRHLDELPQLLLVPFGILSLVGPRPKMPDAVEPVDPTYGRRRVQVRQGCTGLWQIGEHTSRLPDEHPEYDFFYLDHASLRLDLWILWRTAMLVAGLAAPVRLDQVPPWALGAGGAVATEVAGIGPKVALQAERG